jgi:hypothetical protein
MPPQLMTMSAAIVPVSPPASQSTPVTRFAVIGDGGDLHPLDDLRAPHPRALGQRHRDVGGVALAVAGQVHGAGDVADLDMGIHRLDLGGRSPHVHVEGAGQRGLAQEFLPPVAVSPREIEPHLPHAGGDAGFLLELDVEIGGILREPRHVLGAAQLPDQAGGMPGRAAGQLLAFQQTMSVQPSLAR